MAESPISEPQAAALFDRLVQAAIHLSRRDLENSLLHSVVLVDALAQSTRPSKKTRASYAAYLNDQREFLVWMAFHGTIEIRDVGSFQLEWGNGALNPTRPSDRWTIGDWVYFALRCPLIHEGGLPRMRFVPWVGFASDGGRVDVPEGFVDGLFWTLAGDPLFIGRQFPGNPRIHLGTSVIVLNEILGDRAKVHRAFGFASR